MLSSFDADLTSVVVSRRRGSGTAKILSSGPDRRGPNDTFQRLWDFRALNFLTTINFENALNQPKEKEPHNPLQTIVMHLYFLFLRQAQR